ncbi:mucin-4-like [Bradysia coprophila]|uniref:mucin-4-like n=1 Tax=Bradysia coprophila TaxID=38358 RepID=UPI00187DCCCA|nr:mucin-4-like [Bradysia coprophila]
MWMKIIGCVTLTIFLNYDGICGNVSPPMVHRNVEPADNIKISKNVTIHRHGFGRFLGLLKLLKGFHHKRHIYNPYVISRLWRASFEFEVNPQPIFGHEMSSNIYFPTDFGVAGGGVVSSGKPSNSGLGSNSIDSIFHFGNNEQQSSVTIGGSNQITKGERDEIPIGQNQVIHKDAIDTVTANDTENEVAGKSERVLRHAIHARIDDEESDPDVDETTTVSSSSLNTEESETVGTSMTMPQTTMQMETSMPQTTMQMETSMPETTMQMETLMPETTMQTETSMPQSTMQTETSMPQTTMQTETSMPQTTMQTETSMPQTTMQTETLMAQTIGSTESLIPQTTVLEATSIYQTTEESTDRDTKPFTATTPASSSPGAIYELSSSSTAVPSEWLGYYANGIHKPEFIESIEFTTNYPPQLVKEDIHYVTYGAPFKPSHPDHGANAYAYSTNFFNALKFFSR